MEQPKLFGQEKYEVENAADTMTRARELERIRPKVHAAALKLLAKRQQVIGAILRTTSKRKS